MDVVKANNSIELNVQALRLALLGDTISPRGMKTREVLYPQFVLTEPRRALPANLPARRLNPAIGSAEALQLISGLSYPNLLQKIAPAFGKFLDGEVLSGAYGPRIFPQLDRVVDRLHSDLSTRQAVLTVWDPLYDIHRPSHDVPCTISLQFLYRDGKLNLISSMRSNDAWLGFPYDIFQFSQLLINIAELLNAAVGHLVHRVGSFHLYERDVDRVNTVLKHYDEGGAETRYPHVGALVKHGSGTLRDLQSIAKQILDGSYELTPSSSLGARWHYNTLKDYQ